MRVIGAWPGDMKRLDAYRSNLVSRYAVFIFSLASFEVLILEVGRSAVYNLLL